MDLPVAFGPLGVPGIASADKIPPYKAIAAIPNRLMISIKSIKNGEYGKIIEYNPSYFK